MTEEPNIATRLGYGLGFAALAFACAGVFVQCLQDKPPVFLSTFELTEASADQATVMAVARLGKAAIEVSPGREVISIEAGAEVLELFRVLEGSDFRALIHESPIVRAYAAFHLVTTSRFQVELLKPLFSDSTPLDVAMYDDARANKTVSEVVIALLCNHKEEPLVARLLNEARQDFRLLAARKQLKLCLAETQAIHARATRNATRRAVDINL